MRSTNTTKALAEKAMAALSQDSVTFSARKNTALSTFRATVQELNDINIGLDECIANADKMIAFYSAEREAAVKAKDDNAAVAQRILEIIGE